MDVKRVGSVSSGKLGSVRVNFPTTSLAAFSLAGNTPTFTSNSDICPQFIAPPDPLRSILNPVIQNQIQYASLVNQNLYFQNRYALRGLSDNPQWLNEGNPDDTLYQQYYNNMISSTIGKFQLVEDTLEIDSIGDAQNINFSVVDTSTIETNRKSVNRIYLDTWAQGILAFTPEDSTILLNIAMQEPLEGGDAVTSAQVMLDLIPVFPELRIKSEPGRTTPSTSQSQSEEIFSKIYPNPNDGTMYLDYQLDEGKKGEVVVYDVYGKKVSSYFIGENKTGILRIGEAALKNGIYFYEIKVNEKMVHSDKIVIIK